ncbi:Protein CMS1 [Penicillium chermesinum]|nr:Protein CMS1 [Penicillium chermesinum]
MAENGAPKGLSNKLEKKRKRAAEDSTKQNKPETAPAATPATADGPSKKKRKNKKNKKAPEQDAKSQDRKDGVDESIGKMDGRLLADYFAQRAQKLDKELSAVELNDLSIPDSCFLDTTGFADSRSLEKLPAFLKEFTSEQKGTPHTLVISAAGLRAADVVRSLRSFQNKESIVGKLFAKHIKLEEAKQFLQRAQMGIGVGTPTRGDLKIDELQRIVIDGSHIDQKQRGIFDMKETHFPLLKLLTRPELRERYAAGKNKTQILVF